MREMERPVNKVDQPQRVVDFAKTLIRERINAITLAEAGPSVNYNVSDAEIAAAAEALEEKDVVYYHNLSDKDLRDAFAGVNSIMDAARAILKKHGHVV